MAHNTAFESRMTWALGVFQSWHNDGDLIWGRASQGDATAVTGRVTYLPYYENNGRRMVHLGAAYSYRVPSGSIQYSQRPESRLQPVFTDTGRFSADSVNLLGLEAAWVHGPFSLQGEYMAAGIDAADGTRDVWLDGMYVQASYILTGENRQYNTARGFFEGVIPKKNFLSGEGWGAWEVAARYSYLNLDRGNLPNTANRVQDMTFGVNWYLNPNVRVSGNYVRSWVDGSATDGAADIFMLRFQMAF